MRRPDPVKKEPTPPRDIAELAINDYVDGRTLFLVSVKGHKSRVFDKERQVAVLLEKLPIWAYGKHEAIEFFESYHTGFQTIHPIVVEIAPGYEVAKEAVLNGHTE